MPNSSKTSGEISPIVRRPTPDLEFKRLSGQIRRGAFACGESEIDKWILNAHKEHGGLRTRVVTAHLKGNPAIAGFYGLCIRLERDQDIDGHGGIFRTEGGVFAAVQLIYIGVSHPMQGCGIGGRVMIHAVREFGEIATRTGICALTLIAINERRAAWYEREFGFRRYGKPSERPKLFLPAQSAIDLIEGKP